MRRCTSSHVGRMTNFFCALSRISLTPRFSGVFAAIERTVLTVSRLAFPRWFASLSSHVPSGVFSVSHSGVGAVAKYIAEQEEHHRKRSYSEELRLLVEPYGLQWRDDKTVETVSAASALPTPR